MNLGFWILDFGLAASRQQCGCARASRRQIQNPKSKIQNLRRGFALVDVIIGGVLLGMGLAVVISLATRSIRMQTDGEKQLTASWLADGFMNMVLIEGPQNYPKLYDTYGHCEAPFEEFEYDVSIQDEGLNLPFRVTTTIHWEGARGPRQVQVQSLMADRGREPNGPRAPFEFVDRINRWYEIHEKQDGNR